MPSTPSFLFCNYLACSDLDALLRSGSGEADLDSTLIFRQKWLGDGIYDAEDWEDIWDTPFKQLVIIRDWLIQFRTLHRAYFNTHVLHKIDSTISLACWRFAHSTGDCDMSSYCAIL